MVNLVQISFRLRFWVGVMFPVVSSHSEYIHSKLILKIIIEMFIHPFELVRTKHQQLQFCLRTRLTLLLCSLADCQDV